MVYILLYFSYSRFVQSVHCATINNTLKNISIVCPFVTHFVLLVWILHTISNDGLSVSYCSDTHFNCALVCILQIGKKDPWNVSELNEIWEEICFCQTLFRRLLVITYGPSARSTFSVNAFRMTSHNKQESILYFLEEGITMEWGLTNAKIELIH